MIQDKRPPRKPLYKLLFLIPGELSPGVIQDEILFRRIDNTIFTATGAGS
jgi:hypothetical protein